MSGNPVRVKIETDSSKLQNDISKSVKKLQEMSKQYEDIQNKLKSRTPEEFSKTLDKALEKTNKRLEEERMTLRKLTEEYTERQRKIREMYLNGESDEKIDKEVNKQNKTEEQYDASYAKIKSLEEDKLKIQEKLTKEWDAQNEALKLQGEELKKNFDVLEAIMNQDVKDQKGAKIKEFFAGIGDKLKNLLGKNKGGGLFDGKGIKQVANGFESMSKYAGRMMFSLLGAQTAFSLISRAVNQIKQDNKELANTINSLWNGIVSFIEPVVNGIVQMLATALNYVIKMLSLIGGTNILKAIDKANKKANAKKGGSDANKLYSFDTSETIQKNGADGTSIEDSYLKDVELNEKLLELVEKIKKFWEEIKAISIDWWENLDFEPLKKGLNDVWDELMPLLDTIGNAILWIYKEIVLPFLGWLIEDIIPVLLEILAPTLDIIRQMIEKIGQILEPLWENVLKPIFEALGSGIHQFLQYFADGLQAIADNELAIALLSELAIVLTAIAVGFDLASAAQAIWNAITSANPVGLLIAGLVLLVAAIGFVIDNWEELKVAFVSTINTMLDAVEGFINFFINGWNGLIDAINSFSVTFPDWLSYIPGLGGLAGKTWSPGLSHAKNVSLPRLGEPSKASPRSVMFDMDIPRLAKGAVIPPNNEFLAMLGDQTRGRNIETPEELLREIVQEESGTGEINIVANGSMSQLIKLLRLELQKEDKRVGNSLVVGG